MRRTWRRTPLRLRLTSAVLALAAVALAVTGAFGARLLRGYLLERVDQQLDAVTHALASEMPADLRQTPVLPSPFHVTYIDAEGQPQWHRASAVTRSAPDVPRLRPFDTEARGGKPFTVDAVRGGGSWRAVALPVVGPQGQGTLVLATSLDEVDRTVNQLVHIDLIVGLAVLAGLAIAGYSLVRTALSPLAEIELTAAAIGRGELSRRVPDNEPGTEMGRLSHALNAMLEQIERAFGARAASEHRARRSEERMRRFVADASHELRTPLTSIRGFAELHRQGAVTEPAEVSRLLARIEDEATRMGLLVEDLLLLARLDHERPLARRPVKLRAVAEASVEAARAAAPDRRIDLVIDDRGDGARRASPDADTDGDADLVVEGDEPRLRQVIDNLIDNALSYSPATAPVTLRLDRARRHDRDLAVIEVVDQGPGLTSEQAERVFERFYRTDAARARATGGTGLGLSIVAAITAAHHGTVEVDSAPGAGTTFRVLLPRPDPAGPPPAPPPAPDAPAAASGDAKLPA